MRETEENYENLRLYCVPARIRNGSFKDANQAPMLEPAYLLSLVSVHACMQLPIRHCLCVLCFRKYIYIYIYIYRNCCNFTLADNTQCTLSWSSVPYLIFQMEISLSRSQHPAPHCSFCSLRSTYCAFRLFLSPAVVL